MIRRALLIAAVATLAVAPVAEAQVLSPYEALAKRNLRPAPLVPTTAPQSLRPLYETLSNLGSRADYALRFEKGDAIIVLERGVYRSLNAAVRAERKRGFTASSTRVRGRSARLLTRRNGPTTRILVWVEDREVYWLASGTPRKVSLKDLRDTAVGLQRLGGYYIGGHADPDNSSGGDAITTDRSIGMRVAWEANCGSERDIRVGNAFAFMVPRNGDTFTFDIAQHRILSGEWNGTVSGTIRPSAITLTVDASAVIDGMTCVSGPVALTLPGGARAGFLARHRPD